MSITGPQDTPYKCGVAIVDIMSGMYAATAILASLFRRNFTKMGEYIDLSYLPLFSHFLPIICSFMSRRLLDVQASFLANQAMNYLVSDQNPVRYYYFPCFLSFVYPIRLGNSHPNIAPYDSLPTKDGFIVVTVGNDSQVSHILFLVLV